MEAYAGASVVGSMSGVGGAESVRLPPGARGSEAARFSLAIA